MDREEEMACSGARFFPYTPRGEAYVLVARESLSIANNRADLLAKKATSGQGVEVREPHPLPPDRITRIPHPVLIITGGLTRRDPRSDDQGLLPWSRFQDSGSSQPPAPFEPNEGPHPPPYQEREVLCQPHLTP